jgi:hypothetical protein
MWPTVKSQIRLGSKRFLSCFGDHSTQGWVDHNDFWMCVPVEGFVAERDTTLGAQNVWASKPPNLVTNKPSLETELQLRKRIW